jgi:RNA polymerase primary sigma factor
MFRIEKLTDKEKKIVNDNLGLVYNEYGRFIRNNGFLNGTEKEDLISNGTLGLIAAVKKWDPSIAKLSTYAKFWIKRGFQFALDEAGHFVSESVSRRNDREKAKKLLASGLPIESEEVGKAIRVKTIPNRLKVLKNSIPFYTEVSIDAECKHAKNMTFHDIIASNDVKSSDDILSDKEEALLTKRTFVFLNEKQKYVIEQHYLMGRTLSNIGDELGVSRERTRQIKEESLSIIRKILKSLS